MTAALGGTVRSPIPLVVALLGGFVAQQQAPPTQQPPTFRSGVTYVEIDATVTDKQGHFVDDLRREDFVVTENGTRQEIAAFTRVDLPVERMERAAAANASAVVPRDSATNSPFNGRVFVLLLDEQNTAFGSASKRVIDAATRFVRQYVGDNDLVAVARTGGSVTQNFTDDRASIYRAIDRFMGQQARSQTAAAEDDMVLNLGLKYPSANLDVFKKGNGTEQCNNYVVMLGTVSAVSAYLTRIEHRRKAVVLFGGGIAPPASANCGGEMLRDAAQNAIRADVNIYSVDVRGLPEAGTPLTMATYGDDPNQPGWASAIRDEAQASKDSIRYLSAETGGFATVNMNDPGPAFARIVAENSGYYLLGFYPANARHDGQFHPLDVKVVRPGLDVRARKGYVAAKTGDGDTDEPVGAKTSATLGAALTNPIPASGIPIRLSAAAFRGEKEKSALSLSIEIDTSNFAFKESGGEHTDALELAIFSARKRKVAIDGHDLIQLSLKGNYDDVRAHGLRLGERREVLPGHYRLLVGIREVNGGLIGTLPLDLDVPDFSKGALSISGIVMTTDRAARTPTTRADMSLKGALPYPPTASRSFARDETLSVFAEVYGRPRGAGAVDLSTRVERVDGSVVLAIPDTHLPSAGPSTPYSARVALGSLTPGSYVLRMAAKGAAGSAERGVPFEIR